MMEKSKYHVIRVASPSEAVKCAVDMGASDSTAILELDVRFFAGQAPATGSEKIEAVLTLFQIFVAEPTDITDDEDEVPASMRRTVKITDEPHHNDNVFVKVLKDSERLSERMVAGVLLLDLVSYSWKRQGFEVE